MPRENVEVPTLYLTIPSPLGREQRAHHNQRADGARCAAAPRRAEVAAAAAAEDRATELVEGREERDTLPCRAEETEAVAAEGRERREEAKTAGAKGRATAEGDILRLKTSRQGEGGRNATRCRVAPRRGGGDGGRRGPRRGARGRADGARSATRLGVARPRPRRRPLRRDVPWSSRKDGRSATRCGVAPTRPRRRPRAADGGRGSGCKGPCRG